MDGRDYRAAALGCLVTLTASNVAESAPISRGNMPAYCRGEVAGMYGTRPRYVKTSQIVKEKNGGYSISGTVDKGNEGIKKFKCRFDKNCNFIDVMALRSDGKLQAPTSGKKTSRRMWKGKLHSDVWQSPLLALSGHSIFAR